MVCRVSSATMTSPIGPDPAPHRARLRRLLSVRNLTIFTLVHCVAFTGLIVCAFLIGKPQPATFWFGFSHGVMYMVMIVAAIAAARLRILSVTSALILVVVGVMGPYVSAYELLRGRHRHEDPLPEQHP
jgi:hypothetical protein